MAGAAPAPDPEGLVSGRTIKLIDRRGCQLISFAGDSVTRAVVMVLIDRRDQLALIELMILSAVRMLLAFLLLTEQTAEARRRRTSVVERTKGGEREGKGEKQVPK